MDTSIEDNLNQVRERIARAETMVGRSLGSVQLVVVSKTCPVEDVHRAWINGGQRRFGESYLQEALIKITDGRLSKEALEWHFIGPIQSRKTKDIAAHFDWVHSVDRLIIAERLNSQRPPHLPPLDVCIQVNISCESSKSGVDLRELLTLASAVATLPRLRLRGLMAIPAPADGFEKQRRPFRALRHALDDLQADGLALDTLSMGMSADLEAAIAEGATLVRVGAAIFGARRQNQQASPN